MSIKGILQFSALWLMLAVVFRTLLPGKEYPLFVFFLTAFLFFGAKFLRARQNGARREPEPVLLEPKATLEQLEAAKRAELEQHPL